MRVKPDCIPCFQRQTIQALRLLSLDDSRIEGALRKVISHLLSISWDKTPPEIDYGVQKIIREFAGGDPYANVKKESNDKALSLYPYCKELVRKSEDPVRTAVKIAIAGNIVDFGALSSYDLEGTLNKVLGSDLAVDHYDLFRNMLSRSRSILYFADNAGEIVFDKLLIETLLELKDFKITFVVKGGPLINDATVEDFRYVKIDGVELKTVSNGEPGTGPDRRSDEVLRWIKDHDITISKGQGNYEVLSEFKGIFYMLMVKCPVVAESLSLSIGDSVLMYR